MPAQLTPARRRRSLQTLFRFSMCKAALDKTKSTKVVKPCYTLKMCDKIRSQPRDWKGWVRGRKTRKKVFPKIRVARRTPWRLGKFEKGVQPCWYTSVPTGRSHTHTLYAVLQCLQTYIVLYTDTHERCACVRVCVWPST